MASPLFRVGDMVRVRAIGGAVGAIVGEPRPYPGGFEYTVLVNARRERYTEADLQPVGEDGELEKPRWVSIDELVREIALAKLDHPVTDALYAYRASRTIFEPYQFRPALKFLRNGKQRILIADEVGLGKTIEAAIIYLELRARIEISRVLVLCPSRLTLKWQDELWNRFGEEFEILDSARVRRVINDLARFGPSLPLQAIASYESLRQGDLAQEMLNRGFELDLLIVDEAHHMRNAEAKTYRLGATLANSSHAAVFLTATPLHLRNRDLFNLLNMLAPDEFPELALFDDIVAPNEFINNAIRRVASGDLGGAVRDLRMVERTRLRDRFERNPFYRETLHRIESASARLPIDDRVAIQSELMQLNTLSSVFTRTRKREVTQAAVRAPVTIRVTLTTEERAFYDAIVRRARSDLVRLGRDARGFGAIMKERQAASCLPAMRSRLEAAARSKHVDLNRS
jgi:hypothetical protein